MVARQQIVSLGFVIGSVKMTITLTEERKQYIYMLCQNILSNYQATIRELAQAIRVIVSSFRAIPYGKMYYKELKKKKKNAKYSPWLHLMAFLSGKLISQRKQQIN